MAEFLPPFTKPDDSAYDDTFKANVQTTEDFVTSSRSEYELERQRLETKTQRAAELRAQFAQEAEALPIAEHKANIVAALEAHRVIILTGATGTGKSTQVPQYILDASGTKPVNILCTQPRRLAATQLAHRVASARGQEVGDHVGFKIGGRICTSPQTRLTFVTLGILREMLVHNHTLSQYTHVIFDEVHERGVDVDLCLAIVKEIMARNEGLRLILMSATVDTDPFTQYFKIGRGAAVICIDTVCFPIQDLYLEEALDEMGIKDEAHRAEVLMQPRGPRLTDARRKFLVQLILHYHHQVEIRAHSFLVFLPGIATISEMHDLLLREMREGRTEGILPYTLHSTVEIEEQHKALGAPPSGQRKVILATNIAESSITVPDAYLIIDTLLEKQNQWDPVTRQGSLNEVWSSKDTAMQRRGRVGRVMPGKVVRMLPRAVYNDLGLITMPEIQRFPLDIVLLKLIQMNWDSPHRTLERCLAPPALANIEVAYRDLADIGAIAFEAGGNAEAAKDPFAPKNDRAWKITHLGLVLSHLPVELFTGLLIAYAYAFGVLEDGLILAAIISRKNPIKHPIDKPLRAHRAKLEFGAGCASDVIAGLKAYKFWLDARSQPGFDFDHEMEFLGEEKWLSLFWLREIEDLVLKLRTELARFGMCDAPTQLELTRSRLLRKQRLPGEDEDEDEEGYEAESDDLVDQRALEREGDGWDGDEEGDWGEEGEMVFDEPIVPPEEYVAPDAQCNLEEGEVEGDEPDEQDYLLRLLLCAAYLPNAMLPQRPKGRRAHTFIAKPRDYSIYRTIEVVDLYETVTLDQLVSYFEDRLGPIQRATILRDAGTKRRYGIRGVVAYVEFKLDYNVSDAGILPYANMVSPYVRRAMKLRERGGASNISFAYINCAPEFDTVFFPIFGKDSQVHLDRMSLLYPFLVPQRERLDHVAVVPTRLLGFRAGERFAAHELTMLPQHNAGLWILMTVFVRSIENARDLRQDRGGLGCHKFTVSFKGRMTRFRLFMTDEDFTEIQNLRTFLTGRLQNCLDTELRARGEPIPVISVAEATSALLGFMNKAHITRRVPGSLAVEPVKAKADTLLPSLDPATAEALAAPSANPGPF